MKKFFLFCSGVDIETLLHEDCKIDHNKYVGIGTAVFFTGLFAFVSATYALYTVFDNWYAALAVGLVWGSFIFSLDRYIVSTLKKEAGKYSEHAFWNNLANKSVETIKASPRIALAILLAIVISKPLELKIFEKEIENELLTIQQELIKDQELSIKGRYEPDIAKRNQEIAMLQAQIEQEKEAYDALEKAANQEADGSGGSGNTGIGSIYKLKRASADEQAQVWRNRAETNNALILDLRNQNNQDQQKLQAELVNREQVDYDGLLARIQALGRLTARDPSMARAEWAIIVLFLCVELAPLLFKILTDRGNYDLKIKVKEESVQALDEEQLENLMDDIKTRRQIKTVENDNLLKAEIDNNQDLAIKLAKSQRKVAEEVIELWQEEQIREAQRDPQAYIDKLVQ